ncbi:LysR family transcriptional regulator [Roseibium album]|uniref:HTH-type transcriptional activator CmpR n=1 Tax=Roseibium album TaxID=311410 RepID=A0A0M7B236_9HYPH|nr:LysR family transcriptional regulator [Roseibium album]MBG6156348.1 LysR family transcriptional regulator for metE and metH [Labrenzia sp. EL_162]MBG6166547.1 LysR family transcriptional regulator for metE and metH [Labrenzia sp. EL_195]MBG6195713.1 LysR family transcriptional regulator for metE and metH [Labrenzia sp. EL_159]CTQ63162.1 HTH-type transcriptional activator CmpR [Roseibium album]CTQ79319.1 HTH-type transcriptional activator CmpR [Roseibium album]
MKPLLDLRHLQLIQAIIETGRITDAAEKLGVTPSALSHRLREAERRLDVPLFTRMHKRLRKTPAAEHMAVVAERILTDLSRAEQDVRRMNAGIQHVVRLSVEAYSNYRWLPSFIRYLKARTDGIDLQIMAGARSNPLAGVQNRHIDIAVVSGNVTQAGLSAIPLFEDPLLYIMSPTHRLADRDFVEGYDIVGEPFITYTKVPEPDREFARLFRPTDSYPQWAATVELPEAIVELVASDLGTSVLSSWALQTALDEGRIVGARVTEEGVTVPWCAVMRTEDMDDDDPIHSVARLLADWCREPDAGFHLR